MCIFYSVFSWLITSCECYSNAHCNGITSELLHALVRVSDCYTLMRRFSISNLLMDHAIVL